MTAPIITNRLPGSVPFFSICIPQFNRTSFLLEACNSLCKQSFKRFEVCISDDCSTDGREAELLEFLRTSGLNYAYQKLDRNSRYDANLRNSIELAAGEFCFLLGNDDSLASPDVLAKVHFEINRYEPVDVGITNYEERGKLYRRITKTGMAGFGPAVAATMFRNFSFLSGVILRTREAQKVATNRWDGSEMYQMFVGCSIIAAGGRVLEVDQICIQKDIAIAGESVDSYASTSRLRNCPIEERRLPMSAILPLVAAAILPYHAEASREKCVVAIARQLLVFTYGFWLVEFRRIQSWRYAAGVYLGLRPQNILKGVKLSAWRRAQVGSLYLITGVLGLTVPLSLFAAMRKHLYTIAKA